MSEPISFISNITFEERTLLDGRVGRNMHEIAREVAQGHANPNHFRAVAEISDKFLGASAGVAAMFNKSWVMEENGLLVPESLEERSSISFSPLAGQYTNSSKWQFNRVFASATRDVVSLTIRPLPILWNAEHIEDRLDQRGHYKFDPTEHLLRILPLGLSMARILEEAVDWDRVKYAPFVLPTADGLFLGTAQYKGRGTINNRISILGFNEAGAKQIGQYEWQPSIELTANTFIGLNEMTSAQRRLKNMLVKFLSPENVKALSLEFCAYGYVEELSNAYYDGDIRQERYEELFVELGELMQSPIWQKGATLSPYHKIENRRFFRENCGFSDQPAPPELAIEAPVEP